MWGREVLEGGMALGLDLISSDWFSQTSHLVRAVIASGRIGAVTVAIGEESAMSLFAAAATCCCVWHQLLGDDGYNRGAAF